LIFEQGNSNFVSVWFEISDREYILLRTNMDANLEMLNEALSKENLELEKVKASFFKTFF
jgi:hypothetical protein